MPIQWTPHYSLRHAIRMLFLQATCWLVKPAGDTALPDEVDAMHRHQCTDLRPLLPVVSRDNGVHANAVAAATIPRMVAETDGVKREGGEVEWKKRSCLLEKRGEESAEEKGRLYRNARHHG